MTKKEHWAKVGLEDGQLTVSQTTNIELKNPDIVKGLLLFTYCELKEDSEGKPIFVYSKKIYGLVPSPNDIEDAEKEIEGFKAALIKTDDEVERIKFIMEHLLKKEAGDKDKQ